LGRGETEQLRLWSNDVTSLKGRRGGLKGKRKAHQKKIELVLYAGHFKLEVQTLLNKGPVESGNVVLQMGSRATLFRIYDALCKRRMALIPMQNKV